MLAKKNFKFFGKRVEPLSQILPYLQSICKEAKELEFFNILNYNFKFQEKNQLFFFKIQK
jgi:hypothetical protein